ARRRHRQRRHPVPPANGGRGGRAARRTGRAAGGHIEDARRIQQGMGARMTPRIGHESIELPDYRFPCSAELYGDGWSSARDSLTAYGFAATATELISPSGIFFLSAGMYFASPGP